MIFWYFVMVCHNSRQSHRCEVRRTFVQCPWKEKYASAFQRKNASICAPLTEHAQASRPRLSFNKTQLHWTTANWNVICTHVFFLISWDMEVAVVLECHNMSLCTDPSNVVQLLHFRRFRISKGRTAMWDMATRNLCPSPRLPQQNSSRQFAWPNSRFFFYEIQNVILYGPFFFRVLVT